MSVIKIVEIFMLKMQFSFFKQVSSLQYESCWLQVHPNDDQSHCGRNQGIVLILFCNVFVLSCITRRRPLGQNVALNVEPCMETLFFLVNMVL